MRLDRLVARTASLESVFLAIADEPGARSRSPTTSSWKERPMSTLDLAPATRRVTRLARTNATADDAQPADPDLRAW